LAQLAEAPPADRAGAAAAIAKGAGLLAVLLAAGYGARLFGSAALAHATPTPGGAVSLVLAGALLCAAGMPRQAVAFAGGYAFGLWPGAALSLLAQLLGCVLDFAVARTSGRAWATRRLRGRLARIDRFLAANPFTATLTLRLLPVGNNLALNLLAGLSGMPVTPFLAATLIGYVPQTIVFALAGSGVHVDRTSQVALGAALFLVSAGLGYLLLKIRKAGGDVPSPPDPPSSV
jgi:uncharacterized membrane protein YdjX (TVP38/TMEM64 family)